MDRCIALDVKCIHDCNVKHFYQPKNVVFMNFNKNNIFTDYVYIFIFSFSFCKHDLQLLRCIPYKLCQA